MKKIWICRMVKFDKYNKNLILERGDIEQVFTSRKLAESYCNWQNRDNDEHSRYWMMYKGYNICEMNFDEIPF